MAYFSRALMASFLVLGAATSAISAQGRPTPPPLPFARRYREGEVFTYVMKASNKNIFRTLRYEVKATGVVQKNPSGQFIESFAWSDLMRNGSPVSLPEASIQFRQVLSLAPGMVPSMPDLSKAAELEGPICDLLTFYADVFIASKANLAKPGDHAYFPLGVVSSFASGSDMLIAEDAIDFDITLKELDPKAKVAVVNVKHVPPKESRVKLPAQWMKIPVADAPNNWVQVVKNEDGTYTAEVGKEYFDCVIRLDLTDGKILAATMDNPVEVLRYVCTDAALTQRGKPIRYRIHRQIELQLMTRPTLLAEPAK